jgi:hypothetical protein
MKKLILIMLVFSAVLHSHAQKVSSEEAVRLAKTFYYEQMNYFTDVAFSDIKLDNAYAVKDNDILYYYVVNFIPHSYVIVSADKRLHPVIAYSFSTSCPQNEEIPPFLWWMNTVKEEIKQFKTTAISTESKYTNEWNRLLSTDQQSIKKKNTKAVAPLLHTTWNQGKYYNAACPEDPSGPGGHAYAGCVPTAIAQVMNYYRWPNQGVGNYTYLDSTYGIQSADFSATNYIWDHMPMSLSNHNFDIAQLLYHIGVSCDLRYGPNGSGMYNHKAGYSYRTFFAYVDSTRYMFRDTASFDWRGVLIDHLDRGMPLYYAGWADTIYVSGHAFVCDGYQDSTFFHFNWGWGGSYDGFFNLDNLTPGSSNFTLKHEAVINCYPDTAYGAYPYYCSGQKILTALDGSIEDGSGPIEDYLDNSSCSWLIQPQGDSIEFITLKFYAFEMASSTDYVTVYDGSTNADPVLGTFSGSTLPSTLNSSGDALLVEFHSDGSGTAAGFLAEYTSERIEFCNLNQYVYDADGFIEDGSGTFNYRDSKICRWYIQPSGVGSITLDFINFDIDSTDYLRIYDDLGMVAELKGNSLPPTQTYNTSTMLLHFYSSPYNNAEGFKLHYTSSPVSIEEEENNVLSIYPNPATDQIFLQINISEEEDMLIEIYSLDGQRIYQEEITINDKALDEARSIFVSDFAKGIYLVKLTTTTKLYQQKIVLQ